MEPFDSLTHLVTTSVPPRIRLVSPEVAGACEHEAAALRAEAAPEELLCDCLYVRHDRGACDFGGETAQGACEKRQRGGEDLMAGGDGPDQVRQKGRKRGAAQRRWRARG
eukprot:6189089-Pleurochrysis_carterae.AAC.2